ncbi:MAG: DUF3179 domain-containing protein [Planctomycetes bacterium]|nr:DUF3179 domain-containing protein [Planctomycetota bacterium]
MPITGGVASFVLSSLLWPQAPGARPDSPLDGYGPPAPNDRVVATRARPPRTLDASEVLSPKAALMNGIGTDETVLGVKVGDAVRAYPIARVAVEEVLNDTVDNVAIAITW